MNFKLTNKLNWLAMALLLLLTLSACGQKGELYLPDEKHASSDKSVFLS